MQKNTLFKELIWEKIQNILTRQEKAITSKMKFYLLNWKKVESTTPRKISTLKLLNRDSKSLTILIKTWESREREKETLIWVISLRRKFLVLMLKLETMVEEKIAMYFNRSKKKKKTTWVRCLEKSICNKHTLQIKERKCLEILFLLLKRISTFKNNKRNFWITLLKNLLGKNLRNLIWKIFFRMTKKKLLNLTKVFMRWKQFRRKKESLEERSSMGN